MITCSNLNFLEQSFRKVDMLLDENEKAVNTCKEITKEVTQPVHKVVKMIS